MKICGFYVIHTCFALLFLAFTNETGGLSVTHLPDQYLL